MGCAGSKVRKEAEPSATGAPPADDTPPPTGEKEDTFPESGLPASKVPPSLDEVRRDERHSQVRESRLSVRYQAKEISSGRVSSGLTSGRRSSTPFDRTRIGTHTRHGIMPGPRGFSAVSASHAYIPRAYVAQHAAALVSGEDQPGPRCRVLAIQR